MSKRLSRLLAAALVLGRLPAARGDDAPSPVSSAADPFGLGATDEPATVSNSPYAQPFQLRSVVPRTGVRLDTTLAPYKSGESVAVVMVALLSGQVRLANPLALQIRWGVDSNRTDSNTTTRTGIVNPTVGALFGIPVGNSIRFAASLVVAAPLATGGGNGPDPADVALQRAALLARSAMDNATFSTNSLGFPAGVSLAYSESGFTAQIDATIIPTFRVKGRATDPDASKLNSTYGLFLGYFVGHEISLGAEVRYQRYLSTPLAVDKDPSTRANLTLGGGFRTHLELATSVWMRPGLCYGRGVSGPVEQQSFQMVQLDVPVSF